MDLSIVIVNFRAWKHLGVCLESLKYLNDLPQLSCEVIVVDNQSLDDQLDHYRKTHDWVRWLENTANEGFASGCNLGAANADGRCLLFLNPDCLDPHRAIAEIWAKAGGEKKITSVGQRGSRGEPRKVGGVFPRGWAVAGPGRAWLSLIRRLSAQPGNRQYDWVSGSFLMIRRQEFDQLNGWDSHYWMYSEDVDLCRRGHQQGIECQILDEFQITHHHGGSSRINTTVRALTRSEVVISRHRYCQKHFGGTSRALAHALIGIFESIPAIAASWIAPNSMSGQRGKYLRTFYRQVRHSGDWHSPHVNHPPVLD